jgi:hypothetical protein
MHMILNAVDEFNFRFAEALRRLRNELCFAAEAKQCALTMTSDVFANVLPLLFLFVSRQSVYFLSLVTATQ